MRLNYDCIRDVLLVLEEKLEVRWNDEDSNFNFNTIGLVSLKGYLSDKDYSQEDIFYSVHNLIQANYIISTSVKSGSQISNYNITDITYEGHQFLQNIRPKTIWDKSKPVFKNLGTISVDIIKSVTSTVISDTINHYLPGYLPSTQTP